MAESSRTRQIGDLEVHGLDLDPETRCVHYDSEQDVVAIRFACCGEYFSCYRCHDALVNHDRRVWPTARFDDAAFLCGACGTEHSIETYLAANDACPKCDASFNPGCRQHLHYYVETPDHTSPD